MKLLQNIPSWLKNKYLLTAQVFGVWLTFFDDRDIVTTHKHRNELHQLQESRDYYFQQIQLTQKELDQLKNDPVLLEKYAREHYRMKKDNEDIFIVQEKNNH